MELTLIGPSRTQKMTIAWLDAQTPQGNFVVKPGHAPMIVVLVPNSELTIGQDDDSTTIMTIDGGILQVTRTAITLLLTHE